MSKREAFLESVCRENVDDFLHFIHIHKDKAEPFDVEEVVQEMPRNQREALWGQMDKLLQVVLQELPPEWWEKGEENTMEVTSSADPKRIIAVVEGVTLVATVSLTVLQDGDTYSALLETAHKLHDILVSQPVSEAPLQLHIHTLCEAWWKKGMKDKEKFGRTAFLVSLQKTFTLKKPGVEIQRLWGLHDVVLGLDFTSDDNKQLVDLLLQCFQRPFYIRHDDGKRFLVFLFSWNVDFIWVIHGTIKNQLEFFNKTMTNHIMEIYFRAWKKASGDFLETIEKVCIQDFMQHAVLLRRASPVHAKVRQIVSYFHARKDSRSVETMLYNLYKPILWKSLSAPNFEVRANATFLFTDAFPIHDPDQNNECIDETIQKQLDSAMTLLDDPHPVVRSNAILGVCKILAKCWEVLPAAIITDFLKKLVMELAADTSSPDVRCTVFKCLIIVLDNALSHPVLEKFLPTMKYSLHDNSEKVRAAFLDMLIKVKAVRAAKFWDVCNMDHLLARLALDSPSVSKRIVSLLFKSFYPVNEPEREWCCRCITLIQMNPMAARKFYQYAYKHTAPTNIIKLMLSIRRVLNSCIQSDCDLTEIDGNKENNEVDPNLLAKDIGLVSGLLEVVVILWKSVKKTLEQNEEAQKYTFAKFGGVMAKYFSTFEDERCTIPLVQMASFIPPVAVPTFSCGVLSSLRRMEPGAALTQYSQLLICMCSWGQASSVLELITDWLTEALPKQLDKTTSSRKVRIQETMEAKPDLALSYLEFLLSHPSTREKVLDLGQGVLKQIHTVLGNWRSVLYNHLHATAENLKNPSFETALKAFMHHARLGAHLQQNSSESRDYLVSLEHVAAWVSDRVLVFLDECPSDDEKDSDKSQGLATEITESFLTVCRDVLLLGLGDESFKGQILHLCSLVLLSARGYRCIPTILPVLKEVADSYLPEDDQTQEDHKDTAAVILGVVANIFQKIIEILARRLKKEPEEGKRLCESVMPSLADLLQVAETWEKAPLCGVFSTLFAIVIVEKTHLLQKISHLEEVIIPQSLEDLPPFSSMLMSIVLKSPSVTRAFLTEVVTSLDSEAINSLTELAAVLHILAVIRNVGEVRSGLKSAVVSIQRRLHKHADTAVDSGDVQRVIYESSVKALSEILI
ncbi:condensin-2 complex subunit G2 [Thalassophryne amazonica]|uniref:condensin-2 complex subunit G2 n=1 Tax=Thalassophryne amazonica TaxID=390379 RepID=UPI001471A28C|nr:condensin-2 complex subunit G2 [Thalassophryne amazonica]